MTVASKTREYASFINMHQRCRNPNNPNYPRYGGRGVRVCEAWSKFNAFIADMGERPEGTTLDRYPDRDGNYEPNNCRWATATEQVRNRRSTRMCVLGGVERPLAEVCEEHGVDYVLVHDRITILNWPLEVALSTAPGTTYNGKVLPVADSPSCYNGHPINDLTSRLLPSGYRFCRVCNREAQARLKAKRKTGETI